ncbi:hypothetical protein KKF84_02205, partial [Myxococcota bacterium]|nr:hypothetical protein [Myxococcota bacterium]MBU1534100.1 hypothetical protein [Myxococcota bacterium]
MYRPELFTLLVFPFFLSCQPQAPEQEAESFPVVAVATVKPLAKKPDAPPDAPRVMEARLHLRYKKKVLTGTLTISLQKPRTSPFVLFHDPNLVVQRATSSGKSVTCSPSPGGTRFVPTAPLQSMKLGIALRRRGLVILRNNDLEAHALVIDPLPSDLAKNSATKWHMTITFPEDLNLVFPVEKPSGTNKISLPIQGRVELLWTKGNAPFLNLPKKTLIGYAAKGDILARLNEYQKVLDTWSSIFPFPAGKSHVIFLKSPQNLPFRHLRVLTLPIKARHVLYSELGSLIPAFPGKSGSLARQGMTD